MNKADNLLFRRQFIMGTGEAKKFDGWSKRIIGEKYYLYCHPDLQISQLKSDEKGIYVLGYILDPYNPQYDNDQILKEIMQGSKCFDDVLACIDKYSGRWVLIWKDTSGVKIMNDACGTRQIYFYTDNNQTWYGSQPSIIAYELDLETNFTPEIEEFMHSAEYKKECAWIGDGTVYNNLFHLLPNHYIDLERTEVKRFWPTSEFIDPDKNTAVEETARIIRGTILSVVYRFKNVALSVTAGVDSRMNLAASKPVKNKIKYIFCTEVCNKRNTDYRISSQLLRKLDLEQNIIGIHEDDTEFNDIYFKNVTVASDIPSKKFIYSFYKDIPDYIHVSGVGAGIAKGFYNNDNKGANIEKMSKGAGYSNSIYAKSYIEKWLNDAEGIRNLNSVNLYDIFYWEQRMGNWGAKSSAEQDIAIEETWPYNNRKLLSTMLSVNSKYRRPPLYKFHRMVIKHLWKETLSMPINPNLIKKAYGFIKVRVNGIKYFGNQCKSKLPLWR